MKWLLLIIGLFAFNVVAMAQQESNLLFPAPSPDAVLWREHMSRIDSKDLLTNGVPSHYHYLYSLDFDASEEDIRKGLPFTGIKLSRSRCLGFCPAYETELLVTGKASYNGIVNTKLLGKHSDSISLYEFGRICWAIERLKLNGEQPKPRGEIRDTSVTKITITLQSGQTIEVTNHGFPSSIELLLVSNLIDRIAETKEWK